MWSAEVPNQLKESKKRSGGRVQGRKTTQEKKYKNREKREKWTKKQKQKQTTTL